MSCNFLCRRNGSRELYTARQPLDETTHILDAGGMVHRLHSMTLIIAIICPKTQHLSVAEVPDAGKRHRHTKPVGSLDHLAVPHRPPWLNYRRSAGLGNGF